MSANDKPAHLRKFAEEVLSPELPEVSDAHRALLNRLRIVLVEPQHPGNIGSVARAMKVCGLRRLYLVRPNPWRDHDEARWLAHGAQEVLREAIEVETLDEALEGVVTVIGTTHRMGRARGPMLPPRLMAEQMPAMLAEGPVAILFGREDKGLTNEQLARCQMGVHIPTAGEYPSLNLSHAVMVIAYECFYGIVTHRSDETSPVRPSYLAINAMAERIVALVERTGFQHRRGHVGFVRSVREALRRGELTQRDLALMHLACAELERYVDALERGLSPEDARRAPPRREK